MKRTVKELCKLAILFAIDGLIYVGIELLWRGYSHPSMFIVGGLCGILVGGINNYFPWGLGIVYQSLIGAGIITTLEYISGYILNIKMGLNVWDYSDVPFNIDGQVCLPFFFAWVLLATVAIFMDDFLRWKLFNEEKPRYTWFGRDMTM